MESMRKTWSSLSSFALAHRTASTDGTDTPGGSSGGASNEMTEEDMESVAERLSQEEIQRRESDMKEKGKMQRSSKVCLARFSKETNRDCYCLLSKILQM